jgi:alcohol dehydrogenase class IV
MIANVIRYNVNRYNAADIPTKQSAFGQYDRPKGVARYAQIARHLGLGGERDHERVEKLIAEIKQLLLDSYYGRAYAESYERDRETEKPVLRLQQRISG